jgi:TonB family protein
MPVSAIALSFVAHLALFTAMVVVATIWPAEPTKVYIVNLVPAVAAVGSPAGRAHATPQAPPRPEPTARPTAPARPAAPKAPAAATAPAEAPPTPALPEPREATRVPSVRETPALPELPPARDVALPAAHPRFSAPARPTERPAVSPHELARTLPARLAELPREHSTRPVRVAPTGEPVARPASRDVPEVARALRPPALVSPPVTPDPPRAAPAPAPPRPATLPRMGKELPSLAAPPPEPLAPAPVRPVVAISKPPEAPAAAAPAAVALGQPTGSTQGSGPVSVQASDFPFAWYLHAVQRKITEKWAPPARGDGRALVVFEISRNGDVKHAALEGSSGDAVYDQAALRAITDATPFPPLPEQYKSSILTIHLGFSPLSDRG